MQPAACVMADLACPAANPAIASAVLVCYCLALQTPPTTRRWEESGMQVMGAYIHGGAYIRKDLVRREMGAYYPDSMVYVTVVSKIAINDISFRIIYAAHVHCTST